MRIGGVGDRPSSSSDLATALSAAVAHLGQRPAVTAHVAAGRHEQGFLSLAGWASKGANLLRDEFGLTAGDRLGLASPPGWPLAAVTLSAWWLGITIVPASTPGLPLTVRHVAVPDDLRGEPDASRSRDVLWIGDALDGTGVPPVPGEECWTDAVIPHADRAPTPERDGASIAIDLSGAARPSVTGPDPISTQLQLLTAASADHGGVLGILRHGDEDLLMRSDAAVRLSALVVRPLATGAASVVAPAEDEALDDIGTAERVVRWLA
jgi:hypothetical protein